MTVSVLDKALRLQSIARTYAASEEERRTRDQAAAALHDVEQVLEGLRSVADAARAAARAGVALPEVDAVATRGLAQFEARAADGLPSRQALQAAKGQVSKNRSELADALLDAWRSWAAARVAELPRAKAALLDGSARAVVEADLRVLGELAGVRTPRGLTAGDVERFLTLRDRVRRRLDAVEADDPVVALLTRLDQGGGLVLADLSDEEVALLRSRRRVAEQLVLRRRP